MRSPWVFSPKYSIVSGTDYNYESDATLYWGPTGSGRHRIDEIVGSELRAQIRSSVLFLRMEIAISNGSKWESRWILPGLERALQSLYGIEISLMMKKEHLLLFFSTLITLILALGIIRWQAPRLLGLPSDLELVQVDETVPPFYSGVFRWEEMQSREFLLRDPLTRVRARPFHPETIESGPHDLLGFRNRAIPSISDIVVIGDSQTYGNNAILEQNWPSQLRDLLQGKQNNVYAMATGGWGAVQYLDMFANAVVFRPKVAVVAYYSGNDPVESFQMVYTNSNWSNLIPDAALSEGDIPKSIFPAPESEWWRVDFNDGIKTIFTPTLRLASNRDHPGVRAGYKIMANVARRISELARQQQIQVVFTIIPTKELVYAKKVANEAFAVPEDYQNLIASELRHIKYVGDEIRSIPGVVYVDMVAPMQQAALTKVRLYPENINGHPVAAGYRVIAETVAKIITDFVNPIPYGLYGVPSRHGKANIALITDRGGWVFPSLDLVEKNGWAEGKFSMLSERDFARMPFLGVVDQVDQAHFGPR